MVKVSIIVPVYNVEKYIERCLKSLVNQTLKDIEILIINDGTPDNSMKICEKYAKNDNRIKIFNKENEGLGLTRNYGIKRATGEYIAFVDSDDYVDLDYYEKLYNKAVKTSADVCFSNYRINTEKNEILEDNIRCIPFKDEVIDSNSVLLNMLNVPSDNKNITNYMGMSVWRAIYKLDIINSNHILFVSERKYISEDIVFNFDFLENSKVVSFIRDSFYYYCYNGSSLTHIYRNDRFTKNKILINKLIEKSKEYGKEDELRPGIANLFIDYVRAVIKQEVNNSGKYKKEIREEIKRIINDDDVQKALKIKTKVSFRKDVFDYFLKKKKICFLIMFSKARSRMKK